LDEQEEKITTAEVGILTLINKKLKEILEIQKQQIPEGIPVNFEGTVTGTTLIDLILDRPYRPLFSIDVYNGGTDYNLYVKVNDSEEITIKPYRSIPFDYHKAAIRKIQLRVNAGETADYEIVGLC